MYNFNELVFEAMLERMKKFSSSNPFMKRTIDKVSYEYNREQYNDCLRHINEENNHIENINNQISQRGGFITMYEQQELQRHMQIRNEYEMKTMKHFLSGLNDAKDMLSSLNRTSF